MKHGHEIKHMHMTGVECSLFSFPFLCTTGQSEDAGSGPRSGPQELSDLMLKAGVAKR